MLERVPVKKENLPCCYFSPCVGFPAAAAGRLVLSHILNHVTPPAHHCLYPRLAWIAAQRRSERSLLPIAFKNNFFFPAWGFRQKLCTAAALLRCFGHLALLVRSAILSSAQRLRSYLRLQWVGVYFSNRTYVRRRHPKPSLALCPAYFSVAVSERIRYRNSLGGRWPWGGGGRWREGWRRG